MIYYGQYLCSIIVESLNYGYALKGGIFMEVRPRYALWEYDDEALPDYELNLTDTMNKEMGRREDEFERICRYWESIPAEQRHGSCLKKEIEDIVREDEFERLWRYLESIPATQCPMLESNVSYRELTPEEKERFIELLKKD